MTGNTNDWADEIAAGLSTYPCDECAVMFRQYEIAAALRKARADGEEIGERRGRATGLMEASESCIELGRFRPEGEVRQALLRMGLDLKAVAGGPSLTHATARRKAKAEGMREAAKRMDDMPSLMHLRTRRKLFSDELSKLYSLADKIERGEA
jgi:hypothetical protein